MDLRFWKKKGLPQIPTTYPQDFSGIGNSLPKWLNLSEDADFLKCWIENPVLRGIIEIKARAKSNMRFKIKDLRSGEYIDPNSRKRTDAKSLLQLLKQPNPIQSYSEWLFMREVNYAIFGNSYDYGTLPTGFKDFNYQNVTSIKQLPPYLTTYDLTGSYFEQTTLDGIIKSYYLSTPLGNPRPIVPQQIMHRAETNPRWDQFFMKGISKLHGLAQPLSNVQMAFESRNVIMRKRGALGIFTSNMKDANGMLPMLDTDIERAQKAFEKYGTRDEQHQYILSPIPMTYQKTTLNIDELKLFEEVASDVQLICHAYGVPEILAKLYLQGATFENQEASERRLYQGTVIPETENDIAKLNSWLKTEENGLLIEGSFDHVPVLQFNEVEEANAYKLINSYFERMFLLGNCTYAEWREEMDLPYTDEDKVKIWDLPPERLAIIKAGLPAPQATDPVPVPSNK